MGGWMGGEAVPSLPAWFSKLNQLPTEALFYFIFRKAKQSLPFFIKFSLLQGSGGREICGFFFKKNKNKNCGLTEAKHEWQGGGGSPAAVLKLGLVQLLGFAQRLHSTASPLPCPPHRGFINCPSPKRKQARSSQAEQSLFVPLCV